MEDGRRRDVGLFRYSLIHEAADLALRKVERGALVRELASRDHVGPDGRTVRVGRSTLDRWVRTYRAGGFDALLPAPRASLPRTRGSVLDLAVSLKKEAPGRTAVSVATILRESGRGEVSARTIQRHFARLGLNTRPDGSPPKVYGRFEAAARNDLWTGDAMHGPSVGGKKAYLLAFIDDHSRLLPGYLWTFAEDTVRLEAALRPGLAARGVPKAVLVDNGSAFVAAPFLRACAVLGVRLIHARPRTPTTKGKIERLFRTVRSQFVVEVEARGVASLAELNTLFSAWVEVVYHRRVHTETGEMPIERFMAPGPPALPTREQLHEAFLWSETRMVTKTSTVSLHGNSFEVDAALIGRRADLVFDPFDLTSIEVRFEGRSMGHAVPVRISRHTHPKARPDAAPAPVPTGIDYLSLLAARRAAETGGKRIDFAKLAGECCRGRCCRGRCCRGRGADRRRRHLRGLVMSGIEGLRAHYGFGSRMPFGKDLAPSMLHASRCHNEATARISWCVSESAIGVVTGECGSGKTVAARAALSGLDASRHTTIYLGAPGVGLRGMYAAITTALGGTPRFHAASLIPQTQDLLAAEAEERGKRTTVVIDEAHLLDAESLEGLRCLQNAAMDSVAPFSLILLGQPVLRRRLRLGAFVALDQRVGLRYVMSGLERSETGPYISHHLSLAGRSDTLFSDDAVALIHQVSRGLPRMVNNLAVQALVAAFAERKAIVDESSARAAVAEVTEC